MYGPLLKVERANYHMTELEAILRRYIRANAKAMRGKINNRTKEYLPVKFVTQLPEHTPTVIGDIVHNLRVSLDHAYWIMVEANGGNFCKHVKFPFGGDRKSIEGSINGQTKTSFPKKEVLDYILTDLQPFEGGALNLYDLHRLDITDKHKLLLPTYREFRFEAGQTLYFRNGGALTGESGAASLIMSNPAEAMFAGRGPIKYTGNVQKAIKVLFGEGEMENRPVLETLRTLSRNIASSIDALEAFI